MFRSRTMMALVVVAAVTSVVAPRAAHADAVEEAKKLLKKGYAAYKRGDLKAAIVHYSAASSLVPVAPGPHRELARVYDELDAYADAVKHYEAYLARKPDAADAAEVRKRIAVLRPKIPPPEMPPPELPVTAPGKLEVDVDPAGAMIFVDGRLVGSAPMTKALELTPGGHDLRVTSDGFEPYVSRVELAAGASLRVAAKLELIPETHPDPPADPGSGVGARPDEPIAVTVVMPTPTDPAPPPPVRKKKSPAGWIAFGSLIGAAAIAAGAIVTVWLVTEGRRVDGFDVTFTGGS